MDDIGKVLGWISFVLLGVWRMYWFVSEKKADKEKPKSDDHLPLFHKKNIAKTFTLLIFGIVGVQLLGVSIFEMPNKSQLFQVIGFILVVLGLGIAIIGRYNLGTNWANCYDYQVKKKQSLITTGIYKYIRHPLYAGLALFLIGAELVVQSYLLYFYLFGLVTANIQAKWEEEVLIKHFGDKYRSYMKKTKRFIPYIW